MSMTELRLYVVKFYQQKTIVKSFQIEAKSVREATALALNCIERYAYWDEIKVEML